MNWFLLNSGKCAAAFNMALDEALLEAMPRLQTPVLRLYGWTEPAATFGYFQKYTEVAATTKLRPLIRRPTGGGIVPHDADWTYSAVFPAGHEWHSLKAEESYRRIHDWLRLAFAGLQVETELAPCCKKSLPGQCFVGHEKYDLLLTPQMPIPAFEVGHVTPPDGSYGDRWIAWSPYTYPFNLTGNPVAATPCPVASGNMPIGLPVIGRRRSDSLVLRACRAFERVSPRPKFTDID